MPKEGIAFPLKSEYDIANSTLEGLRQTSPPSLLELPHLEEATVRVVPHGDRWIQMGMHWMRIHVTPRDSLYVPLASSDGPDLSLLSEIVLPSSPTSMDEQRRSLTTGVKSCR